MRNLYKSLSRLPTPIKSFLKKIRSSYSLCIHLYEVRIAPFIAFRIPFLIWPIYKILKYKNLCFLTNISYGVGHIILETDNFMRRQFLKEIDTDKKYVLILKSHFLSKDFIRLYKHKFYCAICNSILYYLLLPLLIRYRSITLDCGISRSKWQLLKDSDEVKSKQLPRWPKIITKEKNLMECEEMYKRQVRSSHFFPLKDFKGNDESLEKMLLGKNEKIALIHLKTNLVNAVAKRTDPYSYLPTLEYLSKCNYQLVFAGREKMPEVFYGYDIINYAESEVASFSNDIQLFDRADLAITSGGVSTLSECLGTDLLFLNSWHLFRSPGSWYCVCVPAMVQNSSGKFLKFSEQWELYLKASDATAEIFPYEEFQGRNATSDEILAACQELIELKNQSLSSLQKQYNDIPKLSCSALPRVSEYFLRKHQHLL